MSFEVVKVGAGGMHAQGTYIWPDGKSRSVN